MKDSSLSQVGKRIKEIRKNKRMSLQEVAEKSSVTAGLISKIENFKTIPSLPVLLNISRALDVKMADLVSRVTSNGKAPFHLIRKGNGEKNLVSDIAGVTIETLFFREMEGTNWRGSILRLNPFSTWTSVEVFSKQLLYVVSGDVLFQLYNQQLCLNVGDAILIEENVTQLLKNTAKQEAVVFQIEFS